ncbi:oxidoreductase [Klebsiella pneumoniae]|nr:oxidoreductase [Klebsiella pneumoniae]
MPLHSARLTRANLLGLASEQSLYNLTQRTIELEVIPALRHYGIGLIPWSPVGMGMLGGVLKKIAGGRRASPQLQAQINRLRPQLEAWETLCDELGEAPSDVALAWLLQNPVVSAVLSGPRTVEQLRQNLNALTLSLSDDTLKRLDTIWPGPGGGHLKLTRGKRLSVLTITGLRVGNYIISAKFIYYLKMLYFSSILGCSL